MQTKNIMNGEIKDLEWSFKPIIYWMSTITGVKLNRPTNDGKKPISNKNLNRFLTLLSVLLIALNLLHAVYYVYLLASGETRTTVNQINRIADDIGAQQKHENSTSAEIMSRMIDMVDHVLFISGTGLTFFIISFSKLKNVWSAILKIEQQIGLTIQNLNQLRKIAFVGVLLIFLVI